eukprot:459004_1
MTNLYLVNTVIALATKYQISICVSIAFKSSDPVIIPCYHYLSLHILIIIIQFIYVAYVSYYQPIALLFSFNVVSMIHLYSVNKYVAAIIKCNIINVQSQPIIVANIQVFLSYYCSHYIHYYISILPLPLVTLSVYYRFISFIYVSYFHPIDLLFIYVRILFIAAIGVVVTSSIFIIIILLLSLLYPHYVYYNHSSVAPFANWVLYVIFIVVVAVLAIIDHSIIAHISLFKPLSKDSKHNLLYPITIIYCCITLYFLSLLHHTQLKSILIGFIIIYSYYFYYSYSIVTVTLLFFNGTIYYCCYCFFHGLFGCVLTRYIIII